MKNGRLSANDGFWAGGMILGTIAFAIVVAICTSGCAHTEITHGSTACGTFESSDIGLVVPTVGRYATYSSACAAQREAIVRAEWWTDAVKKANDAVGPVAHMAAWRAE